MQTDLALSCCFAGNFISQTVSGLADVAPSAHAPLWPWLSIAGLGAFHGINPAMGWLFAVALGLHRGGRRTVLWALPPIAAGHAIAVGLTLGLLMAAGRLVDATSLRIVSGAVLVGWAVYHIAYGHRHRVRVGMTAGLLGLAAWSFLMAGAHGAGLMLAPAAFRVCGASAAGLPAGLAAVGVHGAGMMAAMGGVALLVHDRLGLGVLRRGWINFDRLWSGALVATGFGLLVTA